MTVVKVEFYSNPVFQSYCLCLEAGVTVLFTWYFAACYEMKHAVQQSSLHHLPLVFPAVINGNKKKILEQANATMALPM